MNAQEPNHPDRNQVEGDDVVEQLGHDENQDASKERYEGCEPEMDIQETSFVFDTASMLRASPVQDGNYPDHDLRVGCSVLGREAEGGPASGRDLPGIGLFGWSCHRASSGRVSVDSDSPLGEGAQCWRPYCSVPAE